MMCIDCLCIEITADIHVVPLSELFAIRLILLFYRVLHLFEKSSSFTRLVIVTKIILMKLIILKYV